MEELTRLALIRPEKSIREAIRQLNENRLQILIVTDEEIKLIGTITDGDIRRALINNITLDEPLSRIMNRNPKFIYNDEEDKAYELMMKYKIKTVPIVEEDKRVVDLISIQDFLDQKPYKKRWALKPNPVFIMAGGKGTRLDPFTKILPKPLIPIGDKPIIEVIMSNFKKYGFNNFLISLNYKAEIIKLYFRENPDGYNISYIQEEEFLGTAGSLALAKDYLQETFIVSNCDVIVDIDFESLLNFHRRHRNQATIVGVVKNMQIPYGVLQAKDGVLTQMTEKPEFDFVINSGVYALEPEIISYIQDNQPVNMPDLLMRVKSEGYKVGVFPISSNWFDIGQWEEYQRTLEYFKKAEAF
ncbi:MAG: nucleotidyltransferase family protein [Bacillota bacterium]